MRAVSDLDWLGERKAVHMNEPVTALEICLTHSKHIIEFTHACQNALQFAMQSSVIDRTVV